MAKNQLFVFLVKLLPLLLLLVGEATATLYQDCGSEDKIISFEMADCDKPPCIVRRPTTQYINITFEAESDAESLTTTIEAKIGGIPFPWPGPGGCDLLLSGECPLKTGNEYFYSAKMPVLEEYPSVLAYVTWKLLDETERVRFCGVLIIDIV
ncbi:NPC intracellular cholesterol transporter 2-like [Macrobrachium rosenbergii]|uniref:NPC intracellular cholesterol transporter 2-like n=1 Tax=Macrobrachium rosenbergii TaxID=79674 RepID=UPI0034D4782E